MSEDPGTGNAGPFNGSTPRKQADTGDQPKKESLFVRVDQPVQGVQFEALTLHRGVDGGIVTPSSRTILYRWLRSKTLRGCAATACPTKHGQASIEFLASGKRYCSTKCALEDWKVTSKEEKQLRVFDKFTEATAESIKDRSIPPLWPMPHFVEDDTFEEVATTRYYVPTEDDTGRILKVECKALDANGEVTVTSESGQTVTVLPAPPAPVVRTMVPNERVVNSASNGFEIRVVTYNILAEIYSNRQMYPYCPLWALKWSYRKSQLLKEIQELNADVVCLQEVQGNHYQAFWYPVMKSLGYEGIFTQKTRDRDGGAQSQAGPLNKVDGCATFYRKNRFVFREKHEFEYNAMARTMANSGMFNRPNASAPINQARTTRVLKRLLKDNIGQALVLECLCTENSSITQTFVVANTHIFWDPEFPEVKLWQTHMLLRELETVTHSNQIPLVLCGDFNSMPDSSVFELISNQHVSSHHPDLEDPVGVLPHASALTHSLTLESVYSNVNEQEPAYTNYTGSYQGVLDYIFTNTQMVTTLGLLDIPDKDAIGAPLPNPRAPSDHIAIAADIRLMYTGNSMDSVGHNGYHQY